MLESPRLPSTSEHVADALERLDRTGLTRRGAELAADAADPDAQVLQVVPVFRSPNLGQQLGVQDDLAGMRREVLKQQPLGAAERDELAALGEQPALEVDLDVVERNDAGARRHAARATENGTNASRQLVGMERLGDVVVRAEVETLGLVARGPLGGQEDDRHGSPLAQLAHHFDAVQVGHDDVKENDVRPNFLGLLEGFLTATCGDHAEAFVVQRQRDELGDSRLVIGNENQGLTVQWTLLKVPIQTTPGA